MLSLIICSRDANALAAVSKSVAETIGVPHEILAIDNSKGQYGLCAAYNMGAARAKYEYLCFMHEDISFKTANWGAVVARLFGENQQLGLLGVVGSSYKPWVPSGWVAPFAKTGIYLNLLQSFKDKRADIHMNVNPNQATLARVAAIDGVWFCTRKSIATAIKFDEITFQGFHCYDVDFSLSVFQKYEVAVTFEILIHHFSEGSFDSTWAVETMKLHKKWRQYLPIDVEHQPKKAREELEMKAFHGILPKALKNKGLLLAILKYISTAQALSVVGPRKLAVMSALLIKKLAS